jgi:hypothetical protein
VTKSLSLIKIPNVLVKGDTLATKNMKVLVRLSVFSEHIGAERIIA